jgi:hypothetical protein
LQSGGIRSPYALSRSRDLLWRALLDSNGDTDLTSTGERVYFLPENVHSPKKIRFVSSALRKALPCSIGRISSDLEQKIIGQFLREVNDTFGFSLDTDPGLSRKNVQAGKTKSSRRMIVLGASHAKRVAANLIAKGQNVCDLSVPGWAADNTSVSSICSKLNNMSITDNDVIFLDPLSNSVFCGTDAEGAPKIIKKDQSGKYHCEGHLSLITNQMCTRKLSICDPILETVKDHKVIILSPIQRYITTRCCSDPGHLQNFTSKNLSRDIVQGLEVICELLQGWGESKCKHVEILDSVGCIVGTTPLKEARFNEGPLWAPEDPVHWVNGAYDMLAEKASEFFQDGEDDQPAQKRPRLMSTVVAAKQPAVSLQAQPKPGWSTGELLRPQGGRGRRRGRGRGFGNHRGRGGNGGPFRGPTRGGGKRFFPW